MDRGDPAYRGQSDYTRSLLTEDAVVAQRANVIRHSPLALDVTMISMIIKRNGRSIVRGALRLGLLVMVTFVAGCTAEVPATTETASSSAATSSESVTTSLNGLPIPADIAAVSASNPGPEAGAVLARCHVGDTIRMEEVASMGKVPAAKDLTTFVPLTGREPQLKESGPVWVVQIHGDVLQLGGEIWTDPTCVVTTNDSGNYATGPVKITATGRVVMPEAPANAPTRGLPPLAP